MRLPLNECSRADGGARRFVAAIVAAAVLGAMAVVGMNTNIGITPSWAAGTPLLNENFEGASVSDPALIPLGDACLTGAVNPSAPPSGHSALSHCDTRTNGPVPAQGVTPGWLQLTDTGQNRTGGVLYDQALPASGGLVVEFEQAQYGGSNADGISFFLADGAYDLDATGAPGGSLGYAQRTDGSTWQEGVQHGFLGLALDAWGNFPRNSENRGRGCTAPGEYAGHPQGNQDNYRPNVTLRGPGRVATSGSEQGMWVEGYCLWASTSTNNASQSANWPYSWQLRGPDNNPENAVRTVRITILPTDTNGYTTITVEIDPDSAGPAGYVQMLSYTTTVPVPSTYKFGFSSSTGGSNDVHLIRNIEVSTVQELEALSLVKEIDSTSPLYHATYAEGDVIPYRFTVTNGGALALNSVTVNDPLVANVNCPSTTLAGAGDPGSSMTCTGTHTVTAQEAAAASGELPNTAVATGLTPLSALVESNESTAIALLETPAPAIELTKHAIWNDTNNDGLVNLGDTVTYTFSVENTGNITLAPVAITDPKIGLTNAMCVASLAPGASVNCGPAAQGIHTINVDDLIANTASNTATATGTPPSPLSNVTDTDSTNTPTVPAQASLTVTKTASVQGDDEIGHEGELITYTFRVTNTGSVPISNPRITDAKLGLNNWWGPTCQTTVAPGQYIDCVAVNNTYTVTNDDLRAGSVVNTAYANASAPANVAAPAQVQDTVTVPTDSSQAKATITLVKNVNNAPGGPGATATPQDFAVGAEPHSNSYPQQEVIRGQGGVTGVAVLPGSYYLKDLQSGTYGQDFFGPAGYTKGAWSCRDQHNAVVGVDTGHWDRIELTGQMDVTCTITNTSIAGTVTWEKTDAPGTHLAGSVWELSGPGHMTGTAVTDCVAATAAQCGTLLDRDPAAGKFRILDLAWGSFTLKETTAPIGYLLDVNTYSFTVGGSTTSIALGEIVNHQAPALTLPLTGGWAQDYIHMAGLALLVFALALGAYRAHRTRRTRP